VSPRRTRCAGVSGVDARRAPPEQSARARRRRSPLRDRSAPTSPRTVMRRIPAPRRDSARRPPASSGPRRLLPHPAWRRSLRPRRRAL